MQKVLKTFPLLVAIALGGLLLVAVAPIAAADAEARKAQIVANLKAQYPQLAELNVVMSDITPTEFDGLEAGKFTVNGRQEQRFLVSSDNTKLWLVAAEPIDVSKSEKQIAAVLAEREAEKAREAAAKQKQLEQAIEGLPVRGNPNAPVTIVEFSDFQCPYCARGASTVDQLLEQYPDDVKVVFKHFPLGFHNWAKPAAIATHCAAQQEPDAFWLLHDKYFAEQKALNAGNVVAKSREFLASTSVDIDEWSECAADQESEAYKQAAAAVDADMALGQSLGVTGTPGFFVNGEFLNGAQPVAAFAPLIEKAKAGS